MNKEKKANVLFCQQLHSYCVAGRDQSHFPKSRPALIDLLHTEIFRDIIKYGYDNSFKRLVL